MNNVRLFYEKGTWKVIGSQLSLHEILRMAMGPKHCLSMLVMPKGSIVFGLTDTGRNPQSDEHLLDPDKQYRFVPKEGDAWGNGMHFVPQALF
jgi:hypothetical protein